MTDTVAAITLLLAKAREEFTPVVGQPTDDDIFRMREALMPLLHNIEYANFVPAGANAHNLVGLIQETTSYVNDWHEAFPRPARPSPYDDTIPDNATTVVKNRMEAAHHTLINDYNAFLAAEKGLSLFIQTVVDEVWYKDLRHALTFYNNVTAHALLEHLVVNSGGLHNNELVSLPAEMLSYYEESEGIPEFLLKLAKAREKLARGGLPMSDEVLLATASSQVFNSLHFPEATREWERLPAASKTWAAWQVKYREAHLERKRLLLANPNSFGGAANNVITMDNSAIEGYLNNLANAATNDSAIMATLLAQIQALTARLDNLPPPTIKKDKEFKAKVFTQAEALGIFDKTGYCHTHGWRVKASHSSKTCERRGRNHNEDATRADTKRGSNKNKGWETNPDPM